MRRMVAVLAVFLAIAIVTLLAPSPPNTSSNGRTSAVILTGTLNVAQPDVGQAVLNSDKKLEAGTFSITEVSLNGAVVALKANTPNPHMDGAHRARSSPTAVLFYAIDTSLRPLAGTLKA